jgi:2-oxopent-4-enoate/cis-2-oxohex-4-enoate hydratase
MRHESGEEIPLSGSLIQPRIEGEIAFILKQDLCGPHVTAEEVIEATEAVVPCFEIVDSRIRDWRIKAQDSIADNASCGLVVVGDPVAGVQGLDLVDCRVVMQKNGQRAEFGSGAQALGSPAGCVAWLANRIGQIGGRLQAGELIISGALVPAVPVSAGDFFKLEIEGLGGVDVSFA